MSGWKLSPSYYFPHSQIQDPRWNQWTDLHCLHQFGHFRVFSLCQISLLVSKLHSNKIVIHEFHDCFQETGINGDEGIIYLGVAYWLLGLCHYVVRILLFGTHLFFIRCDIWVVSSIRYDIDTIFWPQKRPSFLGIFGEFSEFSANSWNFRRCCCC